MTAHQHTNALARETSPYLLQHAHNPVDWMPWGAAAFDKARKENKPVFLSVGYATCYWCHVMEREVFENAALAKVVNDTCVCVKVDREERPDVDALHMAAVQQMTGQGGWPMNLFLTPPGAEGPDDPGLKPFWGGTYIPPKPAHGMPGFGDLVMAVGQAWAGNRAKVLASANQVAAALHAEFAAPKADPATPWTPQAARAATERAVALLGRLHDPEHGGFGDAPKFPQPIWPHFLLHAAQRAAKPGEPPAPAAMQAIRHTLDQMARGGIFDQIGGGFHRYSVDERWLVPHFEKMLYDNGQLLELYAAFLQAEPDGPLATLCRRVLRQTGDYLLREMTDPSGLFWAAQDAEVDGREGLNYLWTREEVRQTVGPADADAACRLFGLDFGTNFRDPHHPQAAPANVLFLPEPLAEKDEPLRERVRAKLKAVRDARKQPTTDDKCLAAWNGLAIAGLARAGAALHEPRFTGAAAAAATAALQHLSTEDGGLRRSWRKNQPGAAAGFLEDYACLAHGLLALHEAGDTTGHWLKEAQRLTAEAEKRFASEEGGYLDSAADAAHMLLRVRGLHDGATPSGTSVMVHNLRDLARLTGDPAYAQRAQKLFAATATVLNEPGLKAVWLLDAAGE